MTSPRPASDTGRLLSLGAKVLCSALHVSGRAMQEALDHSVYPRVGRRTVADVKTSGPEVRLVSHDGYEGCAVFAGDQGAVIVPPDDPTLRFTPEAVASSLPAGAPWPVGDDGVGAPDAALDEAVDAAFVPEAHTAAFCVVHAGRIVAERYADGVDVHTQLESWSMGKSVTATLIGLLADRVDVRGPAPIDEWAGDRRRAIRVLDLLQMSSGLRFSGADETRFADHVRVYMEPMDVFEFALAAPAEHPPGAVGRYRNCDPLALGAIVRRTVDGYLTWPQRALFDRVGVRRQVLETDRHGNFVMTGFDYGTARNWARLGLLYLWRGEFAGQRVLQESWSTLVSSPAHAWERPEYGGLFRLNRTLQWKLPADAYMMAGDANQRVFVVPSLDLVVVRLGHAAGAAASAAALNDALALIVGAVR